MINWYAVALIPYGCMIGAELARRRMEVTGDIYSFQPIWAQRFLMSARRQRECQVPAPLRWVLPVAISTHLANVEDRLDTPPDT